MLYFINLYNFYVNGIFCAISNLREMDFFKKKDIKTVILYLYKFSS